MWTTGIINKNAECKESDCGGENCVNAGPAMQRLSVTLTYHRLGDQKMRLMMETGPIVNPLQPVFFLTLIKLIWSVKILWINQDKYTDKCAILYAYRVFLHYCGAYKRQYSRGWLYNYLQMSVPLHRMRYNNNKLK